MEPVTLYTDIPAPPPISLPGQQSSMKQCLKEFAPHHGYLISIGPLDIKKNIYKYRCHRSGLPELAKDPSKGSKSLKINCPFDLKVTFKNGLWMLSHVNINHNHPPNFDLRPPQHPTPPIKISEDIKTVNNSQSAVDKDQIVTQVDTFLSLIGPRIKSLSAEQQKEVVLQIDKLLTRVVDIESVPVITNPIPMAPIQLPISQPQDVLVEALAPTNQICTVVELEPQEKTKPLAAKSNSYNYTSQLNNTAEAATKNVQLGPDENADTMLIPDPTGIALTPPQQAHMSEPTTDTVNSSIHTVKMYGCFQTPYRHL
ncbi:uncharacterized protein MELLADRAFT_87237 [Melampsora larici-populina 98AG31]|uniref:FAR1 domain-containing protein n=1 Tax=Melampsora larici-populina (strain 98AG31 / pathotype 3-4-7) TaxID=747676 RepID=F4R2Z0_MELLP|nr:uncharacterized protein MELLADRAFT_87237 [Melampsora larici-populina 98AG31]EGG12904.1 hypothetical protein MELLADRAFT_87237 [Melampsora larici-populina 98AG31]